MVDYKIKLVFEYVEVFGFENYLVQLQIEGVWFYFFKKNCSENGVFMEYVCFDENGVQNLLGQFVFCQISVFWVVLKCINVFYIYVKEEQNEIWCVLQGQLIIWLVDCWVGSLMVGVKCKLVFSGEQLMMVYIFSGVVYGYQVGENGVILFYIMDVQFNIEDFNEGCLFWNFFGDDFWVEDMG